MDKQYKYDAFISYRHCELDKFVAEKIHKYLESFKLPKNIRNKKGLKRTKIQRVFRDKEELTITNNLEDPIVQALRDSEYLIVICSPRTKESVWCSKEIEKFIEFHGRQNILTVLIEGEPGDSFPQELLIDEEIVNERGVSTIHRRNVEPLAADVRAESKSKMCKLIKSELLRLIAPIFGVNFDDLRQRHRERRVRKIMTVTIAAAALGTIIGTAGVVATLKIKEQNKEIEKNNRILLLNQAKSLAEKSQALLEEDDRYGAISLALQSLTEYDGMELPYTAEGKYALIQSLGVYDSGNTIRAIMQYETESNIDNIQVNATGEYLMALDSIGKIYVWDVTESELIYTSSDDSVIEKAMFISDAKIAFLEKSGDLSVYDLESKDVVASYEGINVTGINYNAGDKYFVGYNDKNATVYATDTYSSVYEKEIAEETIDIKNAFIAGDWLVYMITTDLTFYEDMDEDYQKTSRIEFVNITNDANSFSLELANLSLENAIYEDGIIYLNSNNLNESFIDSSSYFVAVDVNSKAVVWNTKIDGVIAQQFRLVDINGEKHIVISNYSQLAMLNCNTGAVVYKQMFTNGIVNYTEVIDGRCYILDSDGTFILADMVNGTYNELEYLFECNVDEMQGFLACKKGFAVQTDNRIVLYNYLRNSEGIQYNGELVDFNDEWIDSNNAQEEVRKLGIANYKRVKAVVYSDDKDVIFVSLENNVFEIYNVQTKELINRIEDIDCVDTYLGKDNSGNIYLINDYSYYGYCFDSEYNLVAAIKNFVQVNKDANTLVVDADDEGLWEIPIYSTEELIEIANEVLESN